MNLLQQQCKAMRYENTTQLFEVYPYANDTIEYMEIKKLALQKFRTINTMRCEYDIEKIKYNLKKDKAELYLNGIITERIQGWPENRTLTAPDKEGKNDFTFAKIDGAWKWCPENNCEGTKTDEYSCSDGTIVKNKELCPTFDPAQEGNTTLAECLDKNMDPYKIIMPLIGPYEAVEQSIQLKEEDSKSGILRNYESDYMKRDDQKKLFSVTFTQASNKGAYDIFKQKFLADVKNFHDNDDGNVTNTMVRNAQAINVKWKALGGMPETKFKTISNRYYIAVPEHNAFFRFNFNDFMLKQEGEDAVLTYFNKLCK